MTNTINGTNGDDVIYGSSSEQDIMRGNNGDDLLADRATDHFAGTDKFYGGAGNDEMRSLYGGALMDGGANADTYFFKAGKTNDVGWDAEVFWTPGDFMTIDNTDDGVNTQWIGFGHHELRITVDVEGGVTSTITVHSDPGEEFSLSDFDFI